jgi:hypothetical protein
VDPHPTCSTNGQESRAGGGGDRDRGHVPELWHRETVHTYDLDLVDWDNELVKSVLVDVEHDVEKPKAEWNKNSAWMNVELAFTMIKGQYTGPQGDGNGLQTIVEGIQGVAMDGYAMEE